MTAGYSASSQQSNASSDSIASSLSSIGSNPNSSDEERMQELFKRIAQSGGVRSGGNGGYHDNVERYEGEDIIPLARPHSSPQENERPVKKRKSSGGRQGVFWIATVPQHDLWDGSTPTAKPDGVTWIRGQLEKGNSDTGYVHWQFVFATSKKCSLAQVKRIFPVSGHYELTISAKANDYVFKDETSLGMRFEFGSKPFRRNDKRDWEAIWLSAKTGRIEEIPADVRVVSYGQICRISSRYATAPAIEKRVHVYWGPTGTGKSHRAWTEAGMDAYSKDPRTKWWDGYFGQRNVVIDEFRGTVDISHLLRWFDKYPVIVEVKGIHTPMLFEEVWITSNLEPRFWYPELDSTTVDALLRRLDIHEMIEPYVPDEP